MKLRIDDEYRRKIYICRITPKFKNTTYAADWESRCLLWQRRINELLHKLFTDSSDQKEALE